MYEKERERERGRERERERERENLEVYRDCRAKVIDCLFGF